MDYVLPKTVERAVNRNGTEYKTIYYEPPITLAGVVDESYQEYDNSATYNTGDYVLFDALKKYYRCAADNTSGVHPLDDSETWVDYGAINSYRMLSSDEFISGHTTGSDILIEFDISRQDTFAFVNAEFISVLVEHINLDSGETVFSKVYDGRDYGCYSYSDYYFTEYKALSRLLITNLDYLPRATLRLTFTGAVSLGGCVIGLRNYLGVSLMGTSLKFEDTSKIITSPVTNSRSVVRYGNIRVVDAIVLNEVKDFNLTANKVEGIIGRNILWLPTSKDEFTELISIGYIENFDMPINNNSKVESNTTIIGVL